MRFAAIADVHGNYLALEAVVADIRAHVIEAGTPDARYAILDSGGGIWRATFRQVPYDHDAMGALVRRNGQPELASALATGRIR